MAYWDLVFDVLEVSRAEMDAIAGLPWLEAVDGRSDALHRAKRHHRRTEAGADLPVDKAWLREIDGRAFLYYQNW